MISEVKSCDSEDWSKAAEKIGFANKKYILKLH